MRTCCRSVRNFHEVPHRRQGRERNTDHVCLISCQCDCTKSSYNYLPFVQKLSDHPLAAVIKAGIATIHEPANAQCLSQYLLPIRRRIRREASGCEKGKRVYTPVWVHSSFTFVQVNRITNQNQISAQSAQPLLIWKRGMHVRM